MRLALRTPSSGIHHAEAAGIPAKTAGKQGGDADISLLIPERNVGALVRFNTFQSRSPTRNAGWGVSGCRRLQRRLLVGAEQGGEIP